MTFHVLLHFFTSVKKLLSEIRNNSMFNVVSSHMNLVSLMLKVSFIIMSLFHKVIPIFGLNF